VKTGMIKTRNALKQKTLKNGCLRGVIVDLQTVGGTLLDNMKESGKAKPLD